MRDVGEPLFFAPLTRYSPPDPTILFTSPRKNFRAKASESSLTGIAPGKKPLVDWIVIPAAFEVDRIRVCSARAQPASLAISLSARRPRRLERRGMSWSTMGGQSLRPYQAH